MMISDTSSALNEFLLTYKPVVTFKNRRPGPQLIDIDQPSLLLPSIERALVAPTRADARNSRICRLRFIPIATAARANASSHAVDDFIAAGGRNRKPLPRNWWRKLKLRKRIGYWGPA